MKEARCDNENKYIRRKGYEKKGLEKWYGLKEFLTWSGHNRYKKSCWKSKIKN